MHLTRRDLLKTTAIAGAGLALPSFANGAGYAPRVLPDGRILVLVELDGGNDGLNTVIPYNDINALTAALPDKNALIILYCRSGRMSKEASETLLKLGYTQVWDVEGGMNAWKEAGLPTKTGYQH